MKKVICYGASTAFERLVYAIKKLYDIIAISDRDLSKERIAEKYGINFVNCEKIRSMEYDYILITSCYEEEIAGYLKNELNVIPEKIILYSSFLKEQKFDLGNKNKSENILIARRVNTLNGLNALILEWLYYIKQYEKLDKYTILFDGKYYTNIYQEHAIRNIYDDYFMKQEKISLEDAYESKNVYLTRAAMLEDSFLEISQLDKAICKNETIRNEFRCLYERYFVPNECVVKKVQEEVDKILTPLKKQGKKICAVVERARGYNNVKAYGHYIQPSEEWSVEKIRKLKKEWGFDYILLDTHNKETEDIYQKAFGDTVIMTSRTRIETQALHNQNIHIVVRENRENDGYYQGLELLVSRYVLAQCDFFYSGISSSSAFVMMLKNNFIKQYIYENGRFGFEEKEKEGGPKKKLM